MIPSLDEVLSARAYLMRRFGFHAGHDPDLIRECLREAEQLAGGREEDELAAVLFTLTRRARALGGGWQRVPLMLLANGARARGYEIECSAENIELEELRLGIAGRVVTFEETCAWVAAHLQPQK